MQKEDFGHPRSDRPSVPGVEDPRSTGREGRHSTAQVPQVYDLAVAARRGNANECQKRRRYPSTGGRGLLSRLIELTGGSDFGVCSTITPRRHVLSLAQCLTVFQRPELRGSHGWRCARPTWPLLRCVDADHDQQGRQMGSALAGLAWHLLGGVVGEPDEDRDLILEVNRLVDVRENRRGAMSSHRPDARHAGGQQGLRAATTTPIDARTRLIRAAKAAGPYFIDASPPGRPGRNTAIISAKIKSPTSTYSSAAARRLFGSV